jgi:hypothetical protein
MSLEAHHHRIAVLAPPELSRPAPPLEGQAGAELVAARSPEEIRAVEAVFAHNIDENAAAAALLSTWAGAMVLHDVLADTFAEPAGEVEVEVEPKEKKNSE